MMKKAAIIVLSSLSFMLPSAAQEPVPYAYRPSKLGVALHTYSRRDNAGNSILPYQAFARWAAVKLGAGKL